jgi:hypothetical protein
MATIPLPPDGTLGGLTTVGLGGVSLNFVSNQCVASSDTLTFPVSHDGFLVRFGDRFFSPDIPDGNVAKKTSIGPLVPQVTSGSVIVGYLDFETNKLYFIPIEIETICT